MFKRLAVQVCPRASFFVPGKVLHGLRPLSRSLHVKKKVSSRERYKKFTLPAQRNSAIRTVYPQLDSLRKALDRNSWIDVESFCTQTPSSILSHLARIDTLRIVQLLHTTLRANGPGVDAAGEQVKQKLLLATDRLVDLYKSRVLPRHSGASLRLLGIYKESRQFNKAKSLWKWLSTQEEDGYVSQAVYGAAIEALAYAGEPLAELENLYNEALIRFPGNFASYHLSPEAVVPDRGQPGFFKNVPISLLLGIFTARVLNGDWRNAYLAFDVVLRLIPDIVPKRFFVPIIYHRPLAEAVRVFQLATSLQANAESMAGSLLRRAGKAVEIASMQQRITAAIDAIGILEAEIYTRQRVFSSQISQVLKILTSLAEGGASHENEAWRQFDISIAECGSRLVKLCSPYLNGHIESTLNGMLYLAGKTRQRELVVEVRDTIEKLATWNEVTHRTLVTSMGMSGDADGMIDAWKLLVKHAGQESRALSNGDWGCLAGAVKHVDSPVAVAFAIQQFSFHKLSDEHQTHLKERWTPAPTPSLDTSKWGRNPTEETFSAWARALWNALSKLESRAKNSAIQSVYEWYVSLHGGPNTAASNEVDDSPPTNAQIVYNELTVDPLQPVPTHTEAQMSKTGQPFDILRFNHWMAINDVLLLAEELEKSKKGAVEEAISRGTPLQFDQDQESLRLCGSVCFPTDLEEYRLRILKLRGRVE
ncbi:hypothetical protein FKW77_007567 [Venturia effusa]|uniref:Uncharacterized protein n=1 Tax=Venturia effusa TaxID=50376 RepID=A0A517L7Q6_9PEZI|nr:hypothetical protein FKW77_007567 [Venturia effusa]